MYYYALIRDEPEKAPNTQETWSGTYLLFFCLWSCMVTTWCACTIATRYNVTSKGHQCHYLCFNYWVSDSWLQVHEFKWSSVASSRWLSHHNHQIFWVWVWVTLKWRLIMPWAKTSRACYESHNLSASTLIVLYMYLAVIDLCQWGYKSR